MRNKPMMEFLFSNGASVNLVDSLGCSALHYALLNSSDDLTEYLLEQEADITIVDKVK